MANVTLSQTTIQLTETSADQEYTIALDTNPTGPVTVRLSTDGQSQINVDGQGFRTQDTIEIDDTTPKTVIVRVIDDGTPEGVHPGIITHTVTATEDEDNYPLNTELTGVSLEIIDNDPGLYIQGTPTPIEGGENGTYEFGLSTAPDGDVTVQIETSDGQSQFSLDGGNTFVSSGEITFDETDFTTEITVQGIEDNILEGLHSSTITHTITESEATQGQYSEGQTRQVFATITDNNPDLLTFDNQMLSITEGEEGTYTIKAEELDADITVTIKANGSSLIKVEDDQEFASEQMITLNSTTFEKTITVQAAEDSDVTGPQEVSISHEITNSNSSNFPRGKVGDVTVNIADNDPGVIITQATGQIEEGDENEYTIALSTNPDGDVTITLESDDNSDIKLPDGTEFEDQLTITLSDTTPQTIKVQATEDNDPSEGSPHESTITHTITDTDDTDNYPTNTTIDSATIEIIDDSSSLFDFTTPSSVEEGNEVEYTLRLLQNPGGDVRVTIYADDETEISIDGGTTFAATQEVRFSDTSARTITVKPIDDSTVEGAHTSTISHTITEAPENSDYIVNSKAGDVIVTITDNDPGLIITPASEPTEEGGDLTTYEVALSTTPTSPVRVTITTDGESELALDEGNLNFGTSRNIQLSDTTPTTVTVRGTIDDDVEGLHTSTLRHEITDSTDPNYPEGQGTKFTTIDIQDGTPGVIISNQSLSLSEGQEGTYTISLTTEPTEDVTVTITADEQGLISVDGEEFASQQVITLNQSTLEKEIKVQAIDDQPPEGIHSSIITHSIASADENYSNENTPIEDVTATITDNDIGIVIIGTPQVTEGSTDTYEIGLSTQPTGDVKVTITADDETEISIDGTSFASSQDVTFNDLTLQTITVRGKDDSEFRSLRDSTITHEITESQDNTNYPLDLEIPDVIAEITDDEPGVVIISNLDLTEGGIGTYEIGLNTPPVGDGSVEVTITADPQTRISTDGTNFASSLPIQLRETIRQTITVQVVDDSAVEGDHNSTISHEITGSSDTTNYPLGQEIEDVTIDITDNDPGLIFSDAIAITEGGDEGTYTVALNTVPTGEVTVTLTADDDSLIKVGEGEGEFASEQVITLNPEKLQETISVQAVDDSLVEGTHTSTISHEVTETEDNTNYPIGISGSFSATITDDDPGIVFSETTLSVEEGQEDTYTIGLSTVPASDVTVTITADDDSLIKVDDGEFASEQVITLNAETLEKEITVQGLDDDQVEGDHTSKISHEIASEDLDYDLGELEQEVTVDIADNDPGLIFSQAITITENNGSGTYTVSLNTPPTGAVEITIQADDQSTISLDGTNFNSQQIISLNPTTLEETITVRATQDALVEGVHTSTISHTVTDTEDLENYPIGEGPSYTANIVDDDPGIVFINGPVSVEEGQEGVYTVALSTRPTGDVTVKLTADVQSLIKVDDEEFASEQEITFNAETLEKEITVLPVDDAEVEDDHSSQIRHEITVSDDPSYAVGLVEEFTTNITDNDIPPGQVLISEVSPLTEGGETQEYTIALDTEPAGAVEITITADDNSEISLDGEIFDNEVVVSLTDTTPTTITVQALDDTIVEGDHNTTISYAITNTEDLDKYPETLDIPATEITITDNEAVVPGQVLITEISPIAEGGELGQYTIALDTEPAGPVEITITADDNSEISLDGQTFDNEVV
ncbi:Calx-beta domain-containing protein, partial [Moorena sp. SIO3H5]|uniref:Calx-beta domain-containing protein n=1 Tax=Moorena sp. SIO3H5 TaxID=2607834 RepID=UPI0013BC069F